MNNNQNVQNEPTEKKPTPGTDDHTIRDEVDIYNYYDPDDDLSEYPYDGPSYDKNLCASCIHWDGDTCSGNEISCNYYPY